MSLNINENLKQLQQLKKIAYAISKDIDNDFQSLNTDITNKQNQIDNLSIYKTQIENIRLCIGDCNGQN